MRQAAALLARAGFDVAVPTIPGLTRGRLRPDDVEPVVATLAARAAPTVMISVSVGAGPALLAAAEPAVRERVRRGPEPGGLRLGDRAPALLPDRRFPLGHHPRPRRPRPRDRAPSSSRPTPTCSTLPARDVLADPRRAAARPRGPPAADGAGAGPAVARTGRARDSGPPGARPRHTTIVPCPTPRACAWRPPGPRGLASSWWASWTTWRPPGARRGCRVCGSWEGCSSRCTASPGRPDRGFCAGDSRPRPPSAADVSSPVPSQICLVSS